MIRRIYQAMPHWIDESQPVTIEADSNGSQYLSSPISDSDLLMQLRALEPTVVVACWSEVKEVEELGLYRVRYLSDLGQINHATTTDVRYSWKEVKVWVVPSEVAK